MRITVSEKLLSRQIVLGKPKFHNCIFLKENIPKPLLPLGCVTIALFLLLDTWFCLAYEHPRPKVIMSLPTSLPVLGVCNLSSAFIFYKFGLWVGAIRLTKCVLHIALWDKNMRFPKK